MDRDKENEIERDKHQSGYKKRYKEIEVDIQEIETYMYRIDRYV